MLLYAAVYLCRHSKHLKNIIEGKCCCFDIIRCKMRISNLFFNLFPKLFLFIFFLFFLFKRDLIALKRFHFKKCITRLETFKNLEIKLKKKKKTLVIMPVFEFVDELRIELFN